MTVREFAESLLKQSDEVLSTPLYCLGVMPHTYRQGFQNIASCELVKADKAEGYQLDVDGLFLQYTPLGDPEKV